MIRSIAIARVSFAPRVRAFPGTAKRGPFSPVLPPDRSDLAAVLETIIEGRSYDASVETIEDAFHGSRLYVEENAGRFEAASAAQATSPAHRS